MGNSLWASQEIRWKAPLRGFRPLTYDPYQDVPSNPDSGKNKSIFIWRRQLFVLSLMYKLKPLNMNVYKFEKYDFEKLGQKEIYKMKDAFDFIVEKLGSQTKKLVSKLKWREGKNYDYAVMKDGDVTLLIRKYQDHFTFWGYFNPPKSGTMSSEFFMFTYHTDRDKLKTDEEKDARSEDNFVDIDGSIESFIKIIKEGHAHLVWNSAACVIPKYCDVKMGFVRSSIHSYDLLIFGCEELSSLQMELFAQNEMWSLIKKIKPGDKIGREVVEYVKTELPKEYSDPYYHGLGIKFVGGNHMQDVYSLSRYHLGDIKEFFLKKLVK